MCQLSRALGLHHSVDVDGKLRVITELKAHYRHGLKFGKSSLNFLLLTFVQVKQVVLGAKRYTVLLDYAHGMDCFIILFKKKKRYISYLVCSVAKKYFYKIFAATRGPKIDLVV